jgi:transcriptional regulator with XRE-family HTH domain
MEPHREDIPDLEGIPMASEERPVKFSAILAELLAAPGQATSRKKLSEFLQVNEATVSHYVRGRAKPSFDTLIGIARFFNVSLDFLVFGEQPTATAIDDPGSVRAEVRRAVLESADMAGKHLDLMTRISRRLQTEIEHAAKELMSDPGNFGPVGFITAAEAMTIEKYARRLRIITRVFQSDISGNKRGSFFEAVADNLRAGVRYDYLLCGSSEYWQPQVAVFRRQAESAGISFEVLHNYLHFQVVDYEMPAAVAILDFDLQLLQRMEPIFWERQRHVISDQGSWSYMSVEREDAQGGVVIEPSYRESAIRLFERGWRISTAI